MSNNKVTFETQNCVGCRTCELACAFHHRGVFQPGTASIKVSGRPDQTEFTISFYTGAEDGHLACDRCQGQAEPFCVKYCNTLMRTELQTLLNAVKEESTLAP